MSKGKILIVEDDLLIAADMASALSADGYVVLGPVSGESGVDAIMQEDTPDLVVMDIELNGDTDGIELAAKINKTKSIPIIYLTTHVDDRTVKRAENILHSLYLPKPFRAPVLLSQIKLLLQDSKHPTQAPKADFLFVKERATDVQKKKLHFDDLVYVKADRAYCSLAVRRNNDLKLIKLSTPLKDVLDQLDPSRFIRIHKSHAVNLDFVDGLDHKDVVVFKTHSLRLGKQFKDNFLEKLRIV